MVPNHQPAGVPQIIQVIRLWLCIETQPPLYHGISRKVNFIAGVSFAGVAGSPPQIKGCKHDQAPQKDIWVGYGVPFVKVKVGETAIPEEESKIIIHLVVCHLAIWQWALESPSTIPLFGGLSHLYKLVVFQPSLITRWQIHEYPMIIPILSQDYPHWTISNHIVHPFPNFFSSFYPSICLVWSSKGPR